MIVGIQQALVLSGVLDLGDGEARLLRRIGQIVKSILVDLLGPEALVMRLESIARIDCVVHTFAILARRKERTRNLKRSSSVWRIIRRKLVLGSMFPVCSSIISI